MNRHIRWGIALLVVALVLAGFALASRQSDELTSGFLAFVAFIGGLLLAVGLGMRR